MAFDPDLPGHRVLLLAWPVAILGGIVVGAVSAWVGRRAFRLAVPMAVVVGVLLAAGLADVQLNGMASAASLGWRDRYEPMRLAAAQLRRGDAGRPAIVVIEPTRLLSARRWEIRRHVVRALAPDPTLVELHVGPLAAVLEARRPTFDAVGGVLGTTLRTIQGHTWPAVRRALERQPRIIVVRDVVSSESWDLATSTSLGWRIETVDRAGGPAPVPALETPRAVAFPSVLAIVGVLGLIGVGFVRLGMGLDRAQAGSIAVAPAAGAVVAAIVTSSIVLMRLPPGAALALGVTGLVAAAGWLGSAIRTSRRIRAQATPRDEEGTRRRRNHRRPASQPITTTAPTRSTTGVDAP
jgi:hypothetical protein